jgi:GNAT superfamily N-acetyltransferase
MQSDYGDIEVFKIKTSNNFWYLYECLEDDRAGFLHNRRTLLAAMLDGELYGARVRETAAMFDQKAWNDAVFNCNGPNGRGWVRALYMLPCFCVIQTRDRKRTCDIMWVHSAARRTGIGRAMVRLLKIRVAHGVQPEAEAFWRACGVAVHLEQPFPPYLLASAASADDVNDDG